ncbi:MAG: tyrosine-protein phosphatase [Pseudomonadota bacterium]|nr:tyrosine-protein phosphatase [Pseudomonadota bacterium]MEC7485445.1 tyrosine-protein phosphatase [Pseudomonadota bacterium]MEC7852738.1 tyrosine-protein phosphatase [Pseudomonadota bacterium]MEC8269092.1 tyrosine-protein phosphatase [Pseudomonadota bacterium]MEC9142929.1 tyrosine-protein phosphatase [Pseudomonadota bacterium]
MSFVAPPGTRRGLRDWTELIFKDHGFLRIWWHNLHEVAPGMWRSNQPGPSRVHAAAGMGIRTIINLRGPRDDGGWRLEAEACARAGITLLDFTARSRAAPDKAMLHAARELFAEAKLPAMMHCKSGADRAGLMAALFLLIVEKRPVREAAAQLAWKYGHVKQAKTGLLDAFFAAYMPYEDQGMDFFDWVDSIYDPDEVTRNFQAKGWAVRLTDSILRRE